MKALVFKGPGQKAWESVADPALQSPTDAIVRIDSATICGTDLHILKGDVPAVKPGTILGHEAVGTIVELGSAVTTLSRGDRVLVSCISACGRCRYCKEGRYGLCTGGGGWILGHLINGLQAEYARVPFADTSVYRLPDKLQTSRCCSCPTYSPPLMRWACSTGMCSRETRSRSLARVRSAWRQS